MSWDLYRDKLIETGCVQKTAIYGLDGALWSESKGIGVSPAEVKTLITALAQNGGVGMAPSGFFLGGEKYVYLRSDENQVQGKKLGGGVAVAKSKMCILIGIYGENMQPGNCRVELEKVRDYLFSVGY